MTRLRTNCTGESGDPAPPRQDPALGLQVPPAGGADAARSPASWGPASTCSPLAPSFPGVQSKANAHSARPGGENQSIVLLGLRDPEAERRALDAWEVLDQKEGRLPRWRTLLCGCLLGGWEVEIPRHVRKLFWNSSGPRRTPSLALPSPAPNLTVWLGASHLFCPGPLLHLYNMNRIEQYGPSFTQTQDQPGISWPMSVVSPWP